ncbi:MAG: hypothetical protein A2252_06130 [Elusimicrobia bacterium RIFOXYA2_FULL_39_19]|nr:MAG: hypothetical protein A2252_06130 [Elusimicrobia bacterium RIFOXYA2_FULL_39_19]
MAKVILVQPRIGEWDETRSHLCVPVAILSAATLVAKEFDTVLIDTRLHTDWQDRLLAELRQNPLCVGTTTITGSQISSALEISRFVKKHSSVPTVWGGIHPSILPETTLKNEFVDYVVIGEGEYAFLELVQKLAANQKPAGVKGVWYKENGAIIKNECREFCDLNSLPGLPYNLLEMDYYLPMFQGRRTLYFESSRGCVGKCTFCSNLAYNFRKWRAMSPETFIERIKHVYNEYKINCFYFIDDNFFVDTKRAKLIAEKIIAEKLDIRYEVQGIRYDSALKMDDAYLQLMYDSGMRKVHFGGESGSPRILKLVQKEILPEQMLKINRQWAKFNIVAQHNFMAGFPTETIDDIKATIKLIYQLKADNPHAMTSPICPYTPYPGTVLYETAIKEGFYKKEKLEEWIESDYGDTIWISRARGKLLQRIFFITLFLESEREKDMITSAFMKFGFSTYRKIAHWRLKNFFFAFMFEIPLKELVSYFYIKLKQSKRYKKDA